MTIKTATLIRRHILSLQPKEVFYRGDLLRYGKDNVVDGCIYRAIKSGEIIRLLKGVYIRRRADGWKPSAKEISRIRAEMLGRIITEDADSDIKNIRKPDQENDSLTFNTTGRSIEFNYDGRTIRFKETTGKKIKLNDSRIGKAINILWYLGPDFPIVEARRFVIKYLHAVERQQMRQELSGLPVWLMERLISILPNYIPFRYNGYQAELFEDPQFKFESKGSGPSLDSFDFH